MSLKSILRATAVASTLCLSSFAFAHTHSIQIIGKASVSTKYGLRHSGAYTAEYTRCPIGFLGLFTCSKYQTLYMRPNLKGAKHTKSYTDQYGNPTFWYEYPYSAAYKRLSIVDTENDVIVIAGVNDTYYYTHDSRCLNATTITIYSLNTEKASTCDGFKVHWKLH